MPWRSPAERVACGERLSRARSTLEKSDVHVDCGDEVCDTRNANEPAPRTAHAHILSQRILAAVQLEGSKHGRGKHDSCHLTCGEQSGGVQGRVHITRDGVLADPHAVPPALALGFGSCKACEVAPVPYCDEQRQLGRGLMVYCLASFRSSRFWINWGARYRVLDSASRV